MLRRQVISILLLIVAGSNCFVYASEWPDVQPIRRSYRIADDDLADISLDIVDKNVKTVYRLICKPGDYEDADFDYSGLLQCRLASDDAPDLLVQPGASRDWLSRGLFDIGQLTGNCKFDRDFGMKRQFKLRGMQIYISINHLQRHNRREKKGRGIRYSYYLKIAVVPDPYAQNGFDRRVLWPSPKVNEYLLDCKNKTPWWDDN